MDCVDARRTIERAKPNLYRRIEVSQIVTIGDLVYWPELHEYSPGAIRQWPKRAWWRESIAPLKFTAGVMLWNLQDVLDTLLELGKLTPDDAYNIEVRSRGGRDY